MSNSGLMWFDNTDKPLAEKIADAMIHYRKKFGANPNLCIVNPTDLEGALLNLRGVRIASARHILRHHIWVGTENRKPDNKESLRDNDNG